MAQARSKDAWTRTSAILAALANTNRDPKKRPEPYRPSDFDPWSAPAAKPPKPIAMTKVSTSVLAKILIETPDKE